MLSLMVVLRSGRILLSVVVNLLFPPPIRRTEPIKAEKFPSEQNLTLTWTHTRPRLIA